VSAIEKGPLPAAPAFLALACVGAILCPRAASAAPDTAETSGGPTSTVSAGEGGADSIIVNGHYAQPDVAPSKATAPLLNTPQTITIIDKATLEKQNLLTLRDALSTLPGITFGAGEGGGGFGDSINLRGYSANTDITIDGVRDSAQYSRTDTFDIEQIEVYNGANSVFNGSGSVGGTINLVQKQPKAKSETIVTGSGGTDNYYRATVDSNVRVNDLVAFRLNAMYHRNDVAGRDAERFRRWGIAPSVTIGIDSPTRLTLMYVYQHDNNVPQYGVPYYPAGVPYDAYYGYKNIDRQRSNLNQLTAIFDHDFSDHLSIRNLTRYENIQQLTIVDPPQGGIYALNGQCLGNSGVSKAAADGSCTVNIAATGAPANNITVPNDYYLPGGPRGNLRDTRNQLAYDQLDLRANVKTGIFEHNLVIGGAATWEKYDLDTGRLQLNADGTNPYLPSGLPLMFIGDPSKIVQGPATDGHGHALSYGNNVYSGPYNYIRSGLSQGERTDYAAYAFDTTKIGRYFELNFGLRYEHSEGTFRPNTVSTTLGATLGQITVVPEQKTSDNLFSYRLGAVFKPTEATSLYFAHGNSKTPSITTVNGGCTSGSGATFVNFCNVKPESAKNYEIGAKADLFDHRLQLTAAAFRNERGNFKVASNDPTLPPSQVPDGRARVDGIALGASGNITHVWTIFANYNYLKSKVLQSVSDRCVANPTLADCVTSIAAAPLVGGPLQQTPKNSGSLFTTYELPFHLQIGYGATYQGSFAIVTNPSARIAGAFPRSHDYWVHRFFASYPIMRKLIAQVNVQNFTNSHYYTSIRNNGWAVPGASRSATASLSYEF
jgi:catecholate siderophore receptor